MVTPINKHLTASEQTAHASSTQVQNRTRLQGRNVSSQQAETSATEVYKNTQKSGQIPPPRPLRITTPSSTGELRLPPPIPSRSLKPSPPVPSRESRPPLSTRPASHSAPEPLRSTSAPQKPLPPIPEAPLRKVTVLTDATTTHAKTRMNKLRDRLSAIFGRRSEKKETASPKKELTLEDREVGKRLISKIKKQTVEEGDVPSIDESLVIKGDEAHQLEKYLSGPGVSSVDLGKIKLSKSNVDKVVSELDNAFKASFKGIHESEFRDQVWSNTTVVRGGDEEKPMNQLISPNYLAHVKLSENTRFQFYENILQAGKEKMKANAKPEEVRQACVKQAQFTLAVAYKLYQNKNYDAAVALFSAFERTSPKITDQIKSNKLTELRNFFNPEKNYANYRARLSEAKVPYVGLVIKDLTFGSENINEESKAEIAGKVFKEDVLNPLSNLEKEPIQPQKTDLARQIYHKEFDESTLSDDYAKSGLQDFIRRAS